METSKIKKTIEKCLDGDIIYLKHNFLREEPYFNENVDMIGFFKKFDEETNELYISYLNPKTTGISKYVDFSDAVEKIKLNEIKYLKKCRIDIDKNNKY